MNIIDLSSECFHKRKDTVIYCIVFFHECYVRFLYGGLSGAARNCYCSVEHLLGSFNNYKVLFTSTMPENKTMLNYDVFH